MQFDLLQGGAFRAQLHPFVRHERPTQVSAAHCDSNDLRMGMPDFRRT